MAENETLINHLQAAVAEMTPAELQQFRKQLRGSLPDYIRLVAEQARVTVAIRKPSSKQENNSQ